MKPQEVTDALKLSQLKDKIWFVVPSCATTGEGLLEGLVCTPLSHPPPFSPGPTTTTKYPDRQLMFPTGMALQQREITPQRPRQKIDLRPPRTHAHPIRSQRQNMALGTEHKNGERAHRYKKVVSN
jgi:hypothetical protein